MDVSGVGSAPSAPALFEVHGADPCLVVGWRTGLAHGRGFGESIRFGD